VNPTDTREAQEHFFVLPGRALILGIALLTAVALIALAVPMEPLSIDRAWSDAMKSIESPALKEIALVFNALGRGWGWALTLAAVAGLLLTRRRIVALVAFPGRRGPLVGPVGVAESPRRSTPPAGWSRSPGRLVVPVGPCLVWGGDRYSARPPLHIARAADTLVGARRTRDHGDGLESDLPAVHWLSDVIGGVLLGAGIVLTTFAAAQLARSKAESHR
jgi:hypothetical protein